LTAIHFASSTTHGKCNEYLGLEALSYFIESRRDAGELDTATDDARVGQLSTSAAAQRVEPGVSDVLDARAAAAATTDQTHVGSLLLVGRRLGLRALRVRLLRVSGVVGGRQQQPRLGRVELVARLDARLQLVEQRRTRRLHLLPLMMMLTMDVILLVILVHECRGLTVVRDVVQCDVVRQSATEFHSFSRLSLTYGL